MNLASAGDCGATTMTRNMATFATSKRRAHGVTVEAPPSIPRCVAFSGRSSIAWIGETSGPRRCRPGWIRAEGALAGESRPHARRRARPRRPAAAALAGAGPLGGRLRAFDPAARPTRALASSRRVARGGRDGRRSRVGAAASVRVDLLELASADRARACRVAHFRELLLDDFPRIGRLRVHQEADVGIAPDQPIDAV